MELVKTRSCDNKLTKEGKQMATFTDKKMAHRLPSILRSLGYKSSDFGHYLASLHSSEGTPTAEEARKDYRQMIRSRYSHFV